MPIHAREELDAMPTPTRHPGRWMAGAALLLAVWLTLQVSAAVADGPETFAQALPTPTPFRFLTPTPFVPGASTTVTRTTAPQAGGFPMELAIPVLAGGLAAIGGGPLVLRRKSTR